MLFIKLVRYVDTYCKGDKKDSNKSVNFILDEFPNIGSIPDFTKKISTIRSRKLNVAVIFQNLTQLENRYPDGQYEEILGNCDVQLFLGCTDLTTAEYISKRSGQVTVVSSTTAKEWNELSAIEYQPHYRESKTLGKRFLLNPDEVLTLHIDTCLLILRGQKILKAKKFDYTNHPESKYFEQIEILKYDPINKDVSQTVESVNAPVEKQVAPPQPTEVEKEKIVKPTSTYATNTTTNPKPIEIEKKAEEKPMSTKKPPTLNINGKKSEIPPERAKSAPTGISVGKRQTYSMQDTNKPSIGKKGE